MKYYMEQQVGAFQAPGNILRPELLSCCRRDGIKSSADHRGSFPPQHWLPCFVFGGTWNWKEWKEWFITKALVEELISVLEMPPGAGEAAVGGLNGRGFGGGKYNSQWLGDPSDYFPVDWTHRPWKVSECLGQAWGCHPWSWDTWEAQLGVQEGDRI